MKGYGPSLRNTCGECSESHWLSLVAYLILELLQVVVMYCLVLIIRIKFMPSPLIVLVPHCQMQELAFLVASNNILNSRISTLWKVQMAFYGIINLDVFRYIIPEFCVSPYLKAFEITYLNYIPLIYLLMLLVFTWVCINLHSRSVRIILWLWKKLNGLLIRINATWDAIIDAFVTVFLLSYANLAFTSNLIWTALTPIVIWNANNSSVLGHLRVYSDPDVNYFVGEHLPSAAVSSLIAIFVVLLLPTLLALYPTKCFRSFLFHCPIINRHMGAINTFLDKFYCCYRDGLDGGRDMRSFASLYYFVQWLFFIIRFTELPSLRGIYVNASDILFTVIGVLVAVIQPYKKTYMNKIDVLVLANLGLFFHSLDECRYRQNTQSSTETCYILLSLLNMIVPLAVLIVIGYRVFILLRRLSYCWLNIRDIHDEELVEQSSFIDDARELTPEPDQESNYGSTKFNNPQHNNVLGV